MPRYTTRPQQQTFRTVRLPSGPVTIVSDATYQRARAKANAVLARTARLGGWEGETEGREVHDDGSRSEDQPTGLLSADGEMIYRVRNGIGYLANL